MSMSSFAAGFFTAWFILSLILFLTEELTIDKYIEFKSDWYLIAATMPVSVPACLVCYALRYLLKFVQFLRPKLRRNRFGG